MSDCHFSFYTLKKFEKILNPALCINDLLTMCLIKFSYKITKREDFMENQKVNNSPAGRIVSIDGSLCNLVLQKFCYNDDGTIKAVVIDEGRSRSNGNTFYLCEFPNRERKWINSNLCWSEDKFVGISENATCVRRGNKYGAK